MFVLASVSLALVFVFCQNNMISGISQLTFYENRFLFVLCLWEPFYFKPSLIHFATLEREGEWSIKAMLLTILIVG